MFFADLDLPLRKTATLKRPPIPETGWRAPQSFPNLSSACMIGVDVEGYDPLLTQFGPGTVRGDSHLIGFSVAAEDLLGNKGKWYFPFRHEVCPERNLDARNCLAWLHHIMQSTPHIPKVGANLLYDVQALQHEGVIIPRQTQLYDVQFAEALIDEQGEMSLDFLAHKYLGHGKTTSELYAWSRDAYGGGTDQRKNMYRLPPQLVGPYAEDDAADPLDILKWQWSIMEREQTLGVFHLECAQIRMITEMRRVGVKVDLPYTQRLYDELAGDIRDLYAKLRHATGVQIDFGEGTGVNVPQLVARCFDTVGIKYPQTAGGAPSFRKEWLKEQKHPVADLINDIREHEKIRSTFLGSYILNANVNGRVHCSFHPLRGEEGGTKTGRWASSMPNLQNIPSRTELGKRVRRAFVPEFMCWEKDDHSQIEYRMHANFAVGPGAEELRQTYIRDPKTDYHQNVFVAYCNIMSLNMDAMDKAEKDRRRRPIKNVNFGLLYGQTEASLAYKAGMSADEAKRFFPAYHEAAPHVKPTMERNSSEVQATGIITTILGRRTRFDLWEPHQRARGEERRPALPYAMALRTYGANIIRAFAYRGTNYRNQGSAADCLKLGMVQCERDGVFDAIGYPRLQVHDELDFDVLDDSPYQREAYAHMRRTLELAPAPYLRVPLRVDHKRGKNWAEAD